MSITSDIRSYADTAVSQGKSVLDQAQAQLNDVTGSANEIVGKLSTTAKENVSTITDKATGAVSDLRASAEKAINLDAIKSAIEPYIAQVKGYAGSVTDRAEGLFSGVKGDKRVSKLIDSATAVSSTVIDSVSTHVVKPVRSFTGVAAKPAATPKSAATDAAAPAPKTTKATAAKPRATKSAATKPAATKPATRKASAPKATKPATPKA